MKITDRRSRRALAANPASKEPGASELKRLAAVRVPRLVGPLNGQITKSLFHKSLDSPKSLPEPESTLRK
jgi:hypothetical protein